MPDRAILFFDGVCNLCNSFVDFLISRNHKRRFYFASLQGETARATLPKDACEKLDSVIFFTEGKLLRKSDAALTVLAMLPAPWPMVKVFYLFPRFFRDFVYDLVANNRYSWFGKRNTCRLPTLEEKSFFLP